MCPGVGNKARSCHAPQPVMKVDTSVLSIAWHLVHVNQRITKLCVETHGLADLQRRSGTCEVLPDVCHAAFSLFSVFIRRGVCAVHSDVPVILTTISTVRTN